MPNPISERALHAHAQAIETLARSDNQGVAVLPAKANVGCPGLFKRHVLNLLSGSVEDRHSFAGQIHIAFRVERHAIRAELAEKFLVGEEAVGLNIVGVSLARADVRHVKRLAIGCADDAVWLLEISGDAKQFLAIG